MKILKAISKLSLDLLLIVLAAFAYIVDMLMAASDVASINSNEPYYGPHDYLRNNMHGTIDNLPPDISTDANQSMNPFNTFWNEEA